MDGTTFRVPDSAQNCAHSGAQACASGKRASLPAGTSGQRHGHSAHLVAKVVFGEYGQNEML